MSSLAKQILGGTFSGTISLSDYTTDDLPEGITNLYFPEAPIDGNEYVRKDGTWSEVSDIKYSLVPVVEALSGVELPELVFEYNINNRLDLVLTEVTF